MKVKTHVRWWLFLTIPVLVIGALALMFWPQNQNGGSGAPARAWDDLGDVRQLAVRESTFYVEGRQWYDFRFGQSADVMVGKLAKWKADMECCGHPFLMTDFEDRDLGPTSWANDKSFTLLPPLTLAKDELSGFQVSVDVKDLR